MKRVYGWLVNQTLNLAIGIYLLAHILLFKFAYNVLEFLYYLSLSFYVRLSDFIDELNLRMSVDELKKLGSLVLFKRIDIFVDIVNKDIYVLAFFYWAIHILITLLYVIAMIIIVMILIILNTFIMNWIKKFLSIK